MEWERMTTKLGKGDSVTVAWRIPGGRANPALAISLSKGVTAQLGLQKTDKGKNVPRVIVERNRLRGMVRVRLAPAGTTRDESRAVAWKDGGCAIAVPLDEVTLKDKKPAQDCTWSIEGGWLTIKLPHWACPLIQVTGKERAA